MGARDSSRFRVRSIHGALGTCSRAQGEARSGLKSALLALCLLISVLGLSAAAKYAINWHTIDGGGGTSTGGVYSVTGTIGQPDAGATMSNGPYAVTGGYWALPTEVQSEGAPTLTIVPAGAELAQIS